MIMRVYLCGPMTGLPEFNYPAFHAAAARLRAKGYEVLSPAEYQQRAYKGTPRPANDTPWRVWLKRGLRFMLKCDAVFVLDGWEKSRGASLEVQIARELEMPVYPLGEAWVSNRRAEILAGQRIGSTQPNHDFRITTEESHRPAS